MPDQPNTDDGIDQPPESFDIETASPTDINHLLSLICSLRCPVPQDTAPPQQHSESAVPLQEVVRCLATENGCVKIGQTNRTIRLSLVPSASLDALPNARVNNSIDLTKEGIASSPLLHAVERNTAVRPLCNALLSVRRHFQVFGVLESPYMDLDFLHGHAGFYDLGFPIHPICCERIHFFSGDETKFEKLVEACQQGKLQDEISDDLGLDYRGYCVLRPIPSYVVGRCAIAFDSRPVNTWDEGTPTLDGEKGGLPCLTAWENNEANVLNTRFTVNAPTFIQQDPNLGRCGTASLWVATHLMAAKCGTHRFHYGTITRQAVGGGDPLHDTTPIYDPSDPDDGLVLSEVRKAFAETGASSFVSAPLADASPIESYIKLSQDIYSFVESGFPVLLFLGNSSEGSTGHVVVAVGHLLPDVSEKGAMLPAEPLVTRAGNVCSERHFLIGNAATIYYVNDDAYGPYNRIELLPPKGKLLKKATEKKATTELFVHRGRAGEKCSLKAVVTPVPSIVRTRSTDPLPELLPYFDTRYASQYDGFLFLWRSVLVEGATFKQSVCARNYSAKARQWYAALHLPRYVWLYELSIVPEEDLKSCFDPNVRRLIAGEFLYDATSSSHDIRLVTERVYGVYRDYRFDDDCLFRDDALDLYECFSLTDIE